VVNSHSYLGVTVPSDLRWHEHVNNISAKATKTVTFIRRNVYCCPPDTISHFDDMLRLWREQKFILLYEATCYMRHSQGITYFRVFVSNKGVFLSISPAYVPIVECCIQ